jgi:uncharacterized protein
MKLNIHQIPPGGMEIDTAIDSDCLGIQRSKRLKDLSPIICELHAELSEKNLILKGSAMVLLDCCCDRCLKECEVEAHSDEVEIVIEDCPDIVDLTSYVREDILLAFPQLCLCKDDCKGLCYSCGQDLNESQCECQLSNEEESSPWDALNNINFDEDK